MTYCVPGVVTLETMRWRTERDRLLSTQSPRVQSSPEARCASLVRYHWDSTELLSTMKFLFFFLLLVTKVVLLNTKTQIVPVWKPPGCLDRPAWAQRRGSTYICRAFIIPLTSFSVSKSPTRKPNINSWVCLKTISSLIRYRNDKDIRLDCRFLICSSSANAKSNILDMDSV